MTESTGFKHLLFTHTYDAVEGFCEGKKITVLAGLAAVLLFTVGIAVIMGTYNCSVADVYHTILVYLTLSNIDALEKLHNTIIRDIRVPRIILAISIGGAPAIAGAVFQGVFKTHWSNHTFWAFLPERLSVRHSELSFRRFSSRYRSRPSLSVQSPSPSGAATIRTMSHGSCDRTVIVESSDVVAEGAPSEVISEAPLQMIYHDTPCAVQSLNGVQMMMPRYIAERQETGNSRISPGDLYAVNIKADVNTKS